MFSILQAKLDYIFIIFSAFPKVRGQKAETSLQQRISMPTGVIIFIVLLFGSLTAHGNAGTDPSAGNLVEEKSKAGTIAVDTFGNVFVTGKLAGANGLGDVLTAKYDGNGKLVWMNKYRDENGRQSVSDAITIDGVGNVYVTGSIFGERGAKEIITLKYDPSGNLMWDKHIVYPEDGSLAGRTRVMEKDEGTDNLAGKSAESENKGSVSILKQDGNGAAASAWLPGTLQATATPTAALAAPPRTPATPAALAAATPSPTVNSYESLNAAVNALAESGSVTIDSATTLSGNLTIPSKLRIEFAKSGSIDLRGYNLTINGPFQAGLYQVFSGGGKVYFGTGVLTEGYPEWWGAKADATTDCTFALRSALTSMGEKSQLRLSQGTYLLTDTITLASQRQHVIGSGMWATAIKFQPTSSLTCFKVQAIQGVYYQGSIRDMSFTSTDSSYTKTAIEVIDASGFLIENIASYPWAGNGTIGIRCRGREFGLFRNLYLGSDRPLVISDNPNNSIDIDHHHFQDLYLTASSTYPCVEIESGVNLTDVTFDGAQAWVLGSYGLRWIDTVSSQVSIGLSIKNVRWEQSTDSTGYLVDIEHNYRLYQLLLENMYGGLEGNGIKLRNIHNVDLASIFYTGSLVGMDINDTVGPMITMRNVQIGNPNSAVKITEAKGLTGSYLLGENLYNFLPAAVSAGAGLTQIINPSKTNGFSQLEPRKFTVAANTITDFSSDAMAGIVMIFCTEASVSAVMSVNAASHSTRLLSQSDLGWFGTSNNAANFNLYWSGSNYVLQNRTGSPCNFSVIIIGGGEH